MPTPDGSRQNDTYPGLAVPELIDRNGNRCALGHLLHVSGHDALLTRLARDHNHAYIRDIMGDGEFAGWVRTHGLTLDEAGYIMGPGYVQPAPDYDDRPGRTAHRGSAGRRPRRREPHSGSARQSDVGPAGQPEDDPQDDPQDDPIEEPEPDDDPTDPEDPESDPQGGEPANPTAPVPPQTRPKTPRVDLPSGRRKRGATAMNTWERWWALNRHAFVNLRSAITSRRT